MSGGPVFDETGAVCGLVCSNMPPYAAHEDHVSLVTLLWPLVGLTIDAPWEARPFGTSYSLYDLFEWTGGVSGLERVQRLADGMVGFV
jgi:hypothetical protein